MRFENVTALVTGAAGNLGQAVADRLAREGGSLLLLDLNGDKATALAEELPGSHLGLGVDLTDREAVSAAVVEAEDTLGAIGAVCAIAGGFDMGPAVHEAPDALWQKMQEINLGTLLPVLAAVTPGMIERGTGKIVTIGAAAGLAGMAGMGAYCAAKSSVMRATESAAAELKGHGINVNCVLPTILDTPQNREAMPDADPANWVSPADLASVIAFLASRDAKALYGALVPVSGRG